MAIHLGSSFDETTYRNVVNDESDLSISLVTKCEIPTMNNYKRESKTIMLTGIVQQSTPLKKILSLQ